MAQATHEREFTVSEAHAQLLERERALGAGGLAVHFAVAAKLCNVYVLNGRAIAVVHAITIL